MDIIVIDCFFNSLESRLIMKKILLTIFRGVKIVLFILFKIISIPFLLLRSKNRIVFSNYQGRGFYDNGKYITNELLNRDTNVEIVWLVNDVADDGFPKGIKVVENTVLNQFWYLVTSKVWVDNSRKIWIPLKRKDQLYVQTWHGGLGLKKVEADTKLTLIHKFVSVFDRNSTDVMISNSSYLTDIYINSFKYEGEILELGYPVNDPLFSIDYDLSNKNDEKLTILYAPTFRGDELESHIPNYFPDWLKVLDEFELKTGRQVELIIRMHPSINFNVSTLYSDPRILSSKSELDIKEIIPTVGVLISDYSSSIFDGLITKKPSILFVPDYDIYTLERGLYFELDELPFPYTKNGNKLSDLLAEFDQKKYLIERTKFIDKVRLVDDGKSSARVVDLILTRGGII